MSDWLTEFDEWIKPGREHFDKKSLDCLRNGFQSGYAIQQAKLDEAVEVIKFYSHTFEKQVIEKHIFDLCCPPCRERIPGTKAREFLEKHK